MGERKEERVCPDCRVKPGELHDEGCAVAWCAITGRRRLACGSHPGEFHPAGVDCRTAWSGEVPGTVECRRYGLFAYPRWEFGEGIGWAPCEESHPKAIPDLNRLISEYVWSKAERAHVPR